MGGPARTRAEARSAKTRDRAGAEAALIAAVGTVIDADGVAGLGVNAVARAAGVDKVLIYRYFGGLDGLLEAFARSDDFWPGADEILRDRAEVLALPFDERVETIMRRYLDALRRRPRTLEILADEVVHRSPLHGALEAAREQMGIELMTVAAADVPAGLDVPAVTGMFSAALHYLLLRSRHIHTYNGVPLDRDEGWDRVFASMRAMVAGLVRS